MSASASHSAEAPARRLSPLKLLFGLLLISSLGFLFFGLPLILAKAEFQASLSEAESLIARSNQELSDAADAAASCAALPSEARADCHRREWARAASGQAPSSAEAFAWLSALAGPALPLSSPSALGEASSAAVSAARSEATSHLAYAHNLREACSGFFGGLACPEGTLSLASALESLSASLEPHALKLGEQARAALAARPAPAEPAPEAPLPEASAPVTR